MHTAARARLGPRPLTVDDLPFGPGFFRKLFDHLYDGVYFVDRNRRILFWNRAAERITGYSESEVLGSYCHARILDHVDGDGRCLCRGLCPLAATLADGEHRSVRVFLRHKDGRRVAVDAHVMPMLGDDGEVVGGVEVFRDASDAVALEGAYERLRALAESDPLTGVANRRQLDLTVASQVELLEHTGLPFSVILADLDEFKSVNDRFGHAAGDAALVAFADLLKRASRPTDLVGRYGGEEFLVVLPGRTVEVAHYVAERLRVATPGATPPGLADRLLTASFGVTGAAPGDTAADLIARADEALYRAKRLGRDRVERQDPPPRG